jgi:isopentenyl diphosphate isomerase/L-lactate dehydrogenase-like FMN-dependent dehydrogenase
VGKPYLYGLTAGGTEGVIKVTADTWSFPPQALDILRLELDRAMGLLGVATVADLKARGPDLIK